MNIELHNRLVALQSTDELKRKRRKAVTKHYWTQEDLDLADRKASEMHAWFSRCGTIKDAPT